MKPEHKGRTNTDAESPGSNHGPLDLQSNALQTDLFRQFTQPNSVAPLTIHMHATRNIDTQNVHKIACMGIEPMTLALLAPHSNQLS